MIFLMHGSRPSAFHMMQCSFFIERHSLNEVESTAEVQWLGHLWNHENMFETGVVRASEC